MGHSLEGGLRRRCPSGKGQRQEVTANDTPSRAVSEMEPQIHEQQGNPEATLPVFQPPSLASLGDNLVLTTSSTPAINCHQKGALCQNVCRTGGPWPCPLPLSHPESHLSLLISEIGQGYGHHPGEPKAVPVNSIQVPFRESSSSTSSGRQDPP